MWRVLWPAGMGETHGFLREDFLHGEKGRVAEDEGLLRQCEFFYIEPRATGEEIRGVFFGFWEKKAWAEGKWEEKAKGRWQARQRRAKQRKDQSSQKRETKGSFLGMIEGSSMHGKGEVAPGFFSDVSRHRATVRSFTLDFCMLAATWVW